MSDLQKSCKDSTGCPCIPCPVSSVVNISHKPPKPRDQHWYTNTIQALDFIWVALLFPLIPFLFQHPVQNSTFHLGVTGLISPNRICDNFFVFPYFWWGVSQVLSRKRSVWICVMFPDIRLWLLVSGKKTPEGSFLSHPIMSAVRVLVINVTSLAWETSPRPRSCLLISILAVTLFLSSLF